MGKQISAVLKLIWMAFVTVYVTSGILVVRVLFGKLRSMRIVQNSFAPHWSHQLQRLAKLKIKVTGELPDDKTIYTVVSNHISYLEAAVLPQVGRAAWIGRHEIKYVPFFGWAAASAGMVYVNRKSVESRLKAKETIRKFYEGGDHLWIFSEGTTSDGTDVLPLKKSVFEFKMDIVPCGIKYRTPTGFNPAWFGDAAFWPHMVELMNLPGIECKVHFFPLMKSEDYPDFTAHQEAVRETMRAWVRAPWDETE